MEIPQTLTSVFMGRGDFRAMVEAKTRRFPASPRPSPATTAYLRRVSEPDPFRPRRLRRQNNRFNAICGETYEEVLRPAEVNSTPAMRPTRPDQLYSTAGATAVLRLLALRVFTISA